MYHVYMDGERLPVAPDKLTLSVRNLNRTVTLINEGEINTVKKAGLSGVAFTALIPGREGYPFAAYESGYRDVAHYLGVLERLKVAMKPFQFIVSRMDAMGGLAWDTNLKVTLEEYKVVEDADDGRDVMVDVSLRQYRDYGAKTVELKYTLPAVRPGSILTDYPPAVAAVVTPTRPADSAPAAKTHTTADEEHLWWIAQQRLNSGERWEEIYVVNQAMLEHQARQETRPKVPAGVTLELPKDDKPTGMVGALMKAVDRSGVSGSALNAMGMTQMDKNLYGVK